MKGEHAGITYQYAASGDRAAAIMIPRPIPRDDTILVGTISDLARRAFKVSVFSRKGPWILKTFPP